MSRDLRNSRSQNRVQNRKILDPPQNLRSSAKYCKISSIPQVAQNFELCCKICRFFAENTPKIVIVITVFMP